MKYAVLALALIAFPAAALAAGPAAPAAVNNGGLMKGAGDASTNNETAAGGSNGNSGAGNCDPAKEKGKPKPIGNNTKTEC